jgi:hypothetical protein
MADLYVSSLTVVYTCISMLAVHTTYESSTGLVILDHSDRKEKRLATKNSLTVAVRFRA